ncbi:hypothetical protein NKI41_23515 [Mesorhizobium sp. M0601]|uniref:hypothetical protein n=1 Tax=Mesorhizobium sp. M0601 TaxID=2956969 RepID=UPI00333BEB1D
MTTGAIIGTSSKAEIVRRPGRLGAARPSAAMVPSGVASTFAKALFLDFGSYLFWPILKHEHDETGPTAKASELSHTHS